MTHSVAAVIKKINSGGKYHGRCMLTLRFDTQAAASEVLEARQETVKANHERVDHIWLANDQHLLRIRFKEGVDLDKAQQTAVDIARTLGVFVHRTNVVPDLEEELARAQEQAAAMLNEAAEKVIDAVGQSVGKIGTFLNRLSESIKSNQKKQD